MARLKLPDGISSVSHGQNQFTADENGIIDTGDLPDHIVAKLVQASRARPATDEDENRADLAAVSEKAAELVLSEKDQLLAELKALGVTDVDGRKAIPVLRRKLAAALEADAAAKAKQATTEAAQGAALAGVGSAQAAAAAAAQTATAAPAAA